MQPIYDGKNGLLGKLHADDLAEVAARLERVELSQGEFLFKSYEIINHVYFFESGLSSEIAGSGGGESIEVDVSATKGYQASPPSSTLIAVRTTPSCRSAEPHTA